MSWAITRVAADNECAVHYISSIYFIVTRNLFFTLILSVITLVLPVTQITRSNKIYMIPSASVTQESL